MDSAATKDKHALLGDKGLIPNIPMSSSDNASSTTKSGVAQGTITITNKDKQKQDIKTLNRDTNNTLNKLDQIFDKKTVQEKQELAGLFAELSFNAIHDVKMKPEQRAAAHALIGLIAVDLAGTKNPSSSMFAAGINELVVQELTKDEKSKKYYDKHPDELQWISAAVGSAVSGMTGGNISGGAGIAASGTKNNDYAQRTYEEGEIAYYNGKYYIRKNDEDVQIEKPTINNLIVWIQDGNTDYGWSYIINDSRTNGDTYFEGTLIDQQIGCHVDGELFTIHTWKNDPEHTLSNISQAQGYTWPTYQNPAQLIITGEQKQLIEVSMTPGIGLGGKFDLGPLNANLGISINNDIPVTKNTIVNGKYFDASIYAGFSDYKFGGSITANYDSSKTLLDQFSNVQFNLGLWHGNNVSLQGANQFGDDKLKASGNLKWGIGGIGANIYLNKSEWIRRNATNPFKLAITSEYLK